MSWLRRATPRTRSAQPAGGQRSSVLVFGAMTAVFIFVTCVQSKAGSLERIINGNIELRALGERLVLREKDSATTLLDTTGNSKCDPKSSRTTLYRWLNDPVIGACLNNVILDHDTPNGVSGLSVGFTLKIEDGLIYPGGINSNALPESSFGFRMLEVNLDDSYPLGGVPYWKEDPVTTPASGYERLGHDKSGSSELYRLPASARLGNPTRPLLVDCTVFTCSVTLHSLDRIAKLNLNWRNDVYNWQTHTFGDPKPEWANYDSVARAIADAIFSYRPKGYLQ